MTGGPRLGFVNPREGDGEVVTSIPVDSVEQGRTYALSYASQGWHAWVRDETGEIVYDSQPTNEGEQPMPAPTRDEERAMMLDPDRWPLWPVLPLKHKPVEGQPRDNPPPVAFLHADSLPEPLDGPLTLYQGNLYRGVDQAEAVRYDSIEAVLDEWEVD